MSKMKRQKKNKKTIVEIVIFVFILLFGLFVVYAVNNPEMNNFIATLKHKIFDNYCTSISVVPQQNATASTYGAYKKGMIRLDTTGFQYYNSERADWKVDVSLSSPVMSINDKYILVGELGSENLYLYEESEQIWNIKVDGEIQDIYVNKNGYVGVLFKNKTFRQILKIFDENGNEVLDRYYLNNYAVAVRISDDNKFFAVAELDLSSNTDVSSNSGIRILSLDNEEKTYFETDSIIIDLKFINNKNLVVLFDKKIVNYNVQDNTSEIVKTYNSSDVLNINLSDEGNISMISQDSNITYKNVSGNIEITNVNTDKIGVYDYLDKVTHFDSLNGILGVSSEVRSVFLNTSGKKVGEFVTDKTIKDMVIFNSGYIAAIVYANEIEFIKIH